MSDQIVHLLTSLFAVIVAIFVFAAAYKRFGRGYSLTQNNKHLKILSTLPLGAREKLLLVQVGDEQLLLGATNQHISTLHQLSKPITFDPASNSQKTFKKILDGIKK